MPEQQEHRRKDLDRQPITVRKERNTMKAIDKDVLDSYNAGIERNRLRTGIGRIEFERTKELLLERLPAPPAVIYDIGGGYGEYAWFLSSLGYEVHLFDLSETNIRMSGELAEEYPGATLAASAVADARCIDRPDNSADAVLLMGPLYHITERSERLLALAESRRVLKDGGLLFAAGINRYSTLLWAASVYGKKNCLLEEPAFMEMVAHELESGHHIKPTSGSYSGIGNSFFHNSDSLQEELLAAGFRDTEIHGIDGCAWMVPNIDPLWENHTAREALMRTVRLTDSHKEMLPLSTHLLGIAIK